MIEYHTTNQMGENSKGITSSCFAFAIASVDRGSSKCRTAESAAVAIRPSRWEGREGGEGGRTRDESAGGAGRTSKILLTSPRLAALVENRYTKRKMALYKARDGVIQSAVVTLHKLRDGVTQSA
jgi:hypothetical protein